MLILRIILLNDELKIGIIFVLMVNIVLLNFAYSMSRLKISGSYHDIGAFASDIGKLSRIVTLNDLSLATGKEGLSMDATARTFRYLDEEEVASQRKAAREKAEKAKQGKK